MKEVVERVDKKVKEPELLNSDIHYKKFVSIFTSSFSSRGHGEVFNDFLDACLILFQTSIGIFSDDIAEAKKAFDKKYPFEEGQKYGELFHHFIAASDNNGQGLRDVLGDLFMDLVSHGKNGQFFTPQHVCDFMACIVADNDVVDRPVETICDPACGSGRMMFAAEKVRRQKENQHRVFKYYNADIDATCCKMTVVNMLLNGLTGYVDHMDSLSLEHYKTYHVYNIGMPHFRTTTGNENSPFFVSNEMAEQLQSAARANPQNRPSMTVIEMLNYGIIK